MSITKDLTFLAVKKQLKGMGAKLFEVGIYSRSQDQMMLREWTQNQILESIAWLKQMNFSGHDIYVRPFGSIGLIFFDDFNTVQVNSLKKKGFQPAILLESSPDNFQGWIRVGRIEFDKNIATMMCKLIAYRFDGDIDSADWRHFGRLAGFTNRKDKYVNEIGQFPFVKLINANQKVCSNAQLLIETAQRYLDKQAKQVVDKKLKPVRDVSTLREPSAFYRSELNGISSRFGNLMDRSRADWMIVTKMVKLGYSGEQIKLAMLEHSPALESRHKHGDNYISITIEKAMLQA